MNLSTIEYENMPQESMEIRQKVFVEEQGFHDEFDEIDRRAHHLIMYDGDQAIACCRYFTQVEPDAFYIGRLAVLKEYRGQKIGERMLQEAEKNIGRLGGKCALLHAQCDAEGFYQKQGYASYGEIEYEEHCPHIWMRKELAHKRRQRYKGTHPRTFEEKYKEHDPEKYAETIAKVISKGSTPAGMHISIMVKEILDFLQIQPGQIGLDATLGYGGHTRKMLEQLQGEGHVYGLDVDPIEIVKTTERLRNAGFGEDIFTSIKTNFANVGQVAQEHGPFNFMLADLGVSSMQIDNPARGFSYKLDGPLDLRLNPERGVSAAERLREVTEDELIGMFEENSDEPYAAEIAAEITRFLKRGGKIETTTDLRGRIEAALSFLPENKEKKDTLKKTCQRVFQALRIDVNSEFEVLEAFLDSLPEVLASGGRIAVLTFHSGEDRLVKKAFKRYKKQGIFTEISEDVIRPSAEECRNNGRARSTKMRWAVRA